MNNVERLAELFGSRAAIAEAVGCSAALVTRAARPNLKGKRGGNGRVPPHWNHAIRSAAAVKAHEIKDEEEREEWSAAVLACLDEAVCPSCGQRIPEGRVV